MPGLGKGRTSSGYCDYVEGMKERGFTNILSYADFSVQLATLGRITPEVSKMASPLRGLGNKLNSQDSLGLADHHGANVVYHDITMDDDDDYEESYFPTVDVEPMPVDVDPATIEPSAVENGDNNNNYNSQSDEHFDCRTLSVCECEFRDCLRDSGIDKHKVLEVVLVGGSTRTPKHEVKATAGDMHADGEDLDNHVADVRMRDCKRKSRGKGLALSRVRSEEPNKFHFHSAAGPVERCLRDSGIVKHYSTIEDGIFDGTANGTEEELMPIDGFGGIALATMGYNKMEIFNPASSMRGPAWHYNHRMCRAA